MEIQVIFLVCNKLIDFVIIVADCAFCSARLAGLQEDNKNLKINLSKVEGERKHAQERSNYLEKV